MKNLLSTIFSFPLFQIPLPAPCPHINISQNPTLLQLYGKVDSLNPLYVPHFLLFPSRCSRSLGADPFPNTPFSMWARKALRRNWTEAGPALEKLRYPESQHDRSSTAPLPKLSIPDLESQPGACIPNDTYVTLARPGQAAGERRPPSSPTIPRRRRSD